MSQKFAIPHPKFKRGEEVKVKGLGECTIYEILHKYIDNFHVECHYWVKSNGEFDGYPYRETDIEKMDSTKQI